MKDKSIVFLESFSTALIILLFSIHVLSWSIIGLIVIIGAYHRVHVEKVFLDDIRAHNVTFYNILLLALTRVDNLTIIAHTSNNVLVLSDRYNPILHLPLIASGIAVTVRVGDETRIGLSEDFLKRLNILAKDLYYNTCYSSVLEGSVSILREP